MVLDYLREFVYVNFIQPHGRYYTVPSTIVYGLLLVLAVWITYDKFLKESEIEVDGDFVKSLVPFIILGGLVRSIGDTVLAIAPESVLVIFLVTPGVYVTLFFVTLASLHISLESPGDYWKSMVKIGGALILFSLIYLFSFGIPNTYGMGLALGIWLLWVPLMYGARYLLPEYLSIENTWITLSHLLDASATFTALRFHSGLFEEHVLPRFLMSNLGMGPEVMFALKLLVVVPVLYYIDADVDDPEYRTWLKLVVLVLGLALGVRDLFVIGMLGTPV